MASTALLNCGIVLALFVSCALLVSVSEGRPIRSAKESGPTPSGDQSVDKVTTGKVVCTFMAPGVQTGLGQSVVANEDDFRPTTPGNSPGVGHSLGSLMEKDAGQKGETDMTVVKSSLPLPASSVLNDFHPTGPGHSPGVGHTTADVNSEPKH